MPTTRTSSVAQISWPSSGAGPPRARTVAALIFGIVNEGGECEIQRVFVGLPHGSDVAEAERRT